MGGGAVCSMGGILTLSLLQERAFSYLILYVRRMSGRYAAHHEAKLVEEKLFYVFGAEAGGLAEVMDGN